MSKDREKLSPPKFLKAVPPQYAAYQQNLSQSSIEKNVVAQDELIDAKVFDKENVITTRFAEGEAE